MAKLRVEIREANRLNTTFVSGAIASGPGSDGMIQLDLLNDLVKITLSEFDIPDDIAKPGETLTISAVPTFPPESVQSIREVVARLKLTPSGANELLQILKNHLEQATPKDIKTES